MVAHHPAIIFVWHDGHTRMTCHVNERTGKAGWFWAKRERDSESEGPLSNVVDAAVYALRRKLCPPNTPQLVHTRRGLGYLLGEL
jgi:hypothetical protein